MYFQEIVCLLRIIWNSKQQTFLSFATFLTIISTLTIEIITRLNATVKVIVKRFDSLDENEGFLTGDAEFGLLFVLCAKYLIKQYCKHSLI